METGPLFQKFRETNKKIIICQGGGDAGKTSDILKYLAVDSMENPGILSTITGLDLPNIKKGALRLFKEYVAPLLEINPYITFNKTENIYSFTNGSIIEFTGFSDERDARGSKRDNLFINECNLRPYQFFWQLYRKTRRKTFLDYNPTGEFWVHNKILNNEEKLFRDKFVRYITNHKHNPFLTEEEHEQYENISDPDLYRVYALGLTGKIKGLIFGHFKPIDEMPQCNEYIYGLDFGFTNDPTALTKIGIKGRSRYIKELSYSPGLQPTFIRDLLKSNGHDFEPIYCDHDINIIAQLRQLGLPAIASHKGPGSIMAGISKVKSYDCYYTKDSINLKNEIDNYKFVTSQDLLTGKEVITNIPVDGWDHCCDSLRMAIYSHSFRRLENE
jgi:phage terminase large subunit